MSDPIDSSSDLREQMEQFDRAEIEADKAGFDATIASEGDPAAPRRTFPRWVIWMIAADILIGIVVAAVIIAA